MTEIASIRRQARIAGLLYTIDAVTGAFYLGYLPNKLSALPLLPWSIASEWIAQITEVFLVLVLYDLFKDVNKSLARQMLVLGLLPIPIVLLNMLNEVAAQMVTNGPSFVALFPAAQHDALATMFIALHAQGLQVGAIFSGLWLFPFGLLIRRCGFIPKILGVLVMFAGVGYLIGSFTSLVLPAYLHSVGTLTFLLELGEPPIILWLLIWGARERR